MKRLVALLGLLLASCSSAPLSQVGSPKRAQDLVLGTAERNPDIVELDLHAMPSGQTRYVVVACTTWGRIGKPSDAATVEVFQTRQVAVLKWRENLDITVPILDKAGKVIAAASFLLTVPADTSEESLVNQAKALAREMAKEIQNAGRPLW